MFFIDNFRLYKNIYKTLIEFYLNFTSLELRDRFRRYNIISITLGPYKSKFKDIITTLKGLRLLDREINLTINKETKFICVYTLIFTGDIP